MKMSSYFINEKSAVYNNNLIHIPQLINHCI